MRDPSAYSASEIANWHVSEEYLPGKWRPARNCGVDRPWFYLPRLRLAWRVFTGKYDALYWGDKSGEKSNTETKYEDVLDKGFKRTA